MRVLTLLLLGFLSEAADPCAPAEWDQVRDALWAAVGDGSDGQRRLQALREGAPPPPLRPSSCLHGAVSLHLLHLLRDSREARLRESGVELMTVLMETSFLKVGAQRWPIFGLLHLAQVQLELEEGPDQEGQDHPELRRWQPLVSDDHMRFRNWVHGHLVHGQTPPLVDSLHFLARADPREPSVPSRSCSAAKAMGYLASALVLAQEPDQSIRQEAEQLVSSAEGHIKHCNSEPQGFELLSILRTEWPIWWLLHAVFLHLFPERASAVPSPLPPSEALSAPALPTQPAPGQRAAGPECWALQGLQLCSIPKAAFLPMNGMYLLDSRFGGLQTFLQLFRDGVPLPRSAMAEAACEAAEGPSWTGLRLWGLPLVAVKDRELPSVDYSASFSPPGVGLYVEASSAGDPYNAEWLHAYVTAFNRMGLQPHIISKIEEAQAGTLYFWRINQMFGGGRLAGAPGVGLAVAEHLADFGKMGAAAWPRPETMQFYQDKLALRELFTRAGVPAPKSWVVASAHDLEELLRRGELMAADFPLVLKHPFAASSRGMLSCGSLAEVRSVVGSWLQEHRVPCLLQKRLPIARDMRITYVGGEIIQGYWRVKASAGDLSSGSAGGSRLDFQVPLQEIAPFVRSFAAATGVDIGGMDIAFPEPGSSEGPVVFEVSPIFDLNPAAPEDWQGRPYREYKQTEDYKVRRAENYATCAQKVIEYALQRRGRLFVDIDNTVSDAWKRIQRAAIPSWPGHSFDARAHSPEELAKDSPLPGAQAALATLTREWEVTYLSARGSKGAFEATATWLLRHNFPCAGRLLLVSAASEKIAFLQDAAVSRGPVLLVDDLTRGHHLARPVPDEAMRQALRAKSLDFEVFDPETSSWPELAQRLLQRVGQGRARSPPVPALLCH